MIIEKEKYQGDRIVIDLTGPDGNVFHLMGYARKFSKQLGIDSKPIIEDMMSGDYENALFVMERYFGSFILFLR